MQFKVLAWIIGIAVLAFITVTTVAVMKASRAEGPPTTGSMAQFKPRNPPVPEAATRFLDVDGHPLDFGSFKGKVTLVNLWATWCTPCVEELPSLERLKRSRSSDKFAVATISEDHGGKIAVVDFFKKLGIVALPEYLDPDSDLSRVLNADGLPTTILLDSDGRELGRYSGSTDWAGDDAWKLIDWYIQRDRVVGTPKAGG